VDARLSRSVGSRATFGTVRFTLTNWHKPPSLNETKTKGKSQVVKSILVIVLLIRWVLVTLGFYASCANKPVTVFRMPKGHDVHINFQDSLIEALVAEQAGESSAPSTNCRSRPEMGGRAPAGSMASNPR
jgi:hypothetical protein